MTDKSGKLNIAINGRFLTQKLSGVQRYSREMVSALDRLISDPANGLNGHDWRLIVPPQADPAFRLQAIKVTQVGKRSGHLWEQVDLARAAKGARLVNLGNSGPILHPNKTVIIHDVAVFRTPANFGRRYRVMHKLMSRAMAKTARIGTVSQFSRSELSNVLGVPADQVFVAYNGCDHLLGRPRSDGVLEALDLKPGGYFLFVGTPAPNKNLPVVMRAFSRLARPDVKLVIAGSLDRTVFGGDGAANLDGVVTAQGRSDADIAALYAGAAAHLFPSVYEGFGIPPLEAMANGCPVLAADIPVIREVCDDAARYFLPHDESALAELMGRVLDDPAWAGEKAKEASARVARFSWDSSARQLAEAIAR